MSERKQITFHRGLLDTAIGLLHTLFGFTTTLWAIARIIIIGYREVLRFGLLLGIYNYLFEANSILLWASGIGILRGKRWGKILASIWAGNTILFHLSSHLIRKHYWGILLPELGWGEILVIYYAGAFLLAMAVKPAMYHLKLRRSLSDDPVYSGSMPMGHIEGYKKTNFREKQ
jgi:hypothetical protein